MNVYFARSIRGGKSRSDAWASGVILKAIREAGHTPALDLPVASATQRLHADAYIFQRDIEWLNQSDALVADVSNPSLGVGWELCYAEHVRRIPVLCLAGILVKISAMVVGHHEIVRYSREYEAALIADIQTFLSFGDIPF